MNTPQKSAPPASTGHGCRPVPVSTRIRRKEGGFRRWPHGLTAAMATGFLFLASAVGAQTTAFTYQGRLDAAGVPAQGRYDLRFVLFNAASGGASQGTAITNAATQVADGLFTVTLDFGANVFTNGADRWLEIGARTNGGGAFTTLNPRQPLTAVPYAVQALNGTPGPQGPIGLTGATGPQGAKGDTGLTGAPGATGPQGPIGLTGATGPAGAQGAQGPVGPQGAKGLNWRGPWSGATVYAIDDAVFHSGSSWVAQLASTNSTPATNSTRWQLLASQGSVGPAGATGPQGAAGPQGVAGATGATGPQGPIGLTGATGPQGPQGLPGSSDGWSRTGNAGTNPTNNFLGTTDPQPLAFRVNGTNVLLLSTNGATSFGTRALATNVGAFVFADSQNTDFGSTASNQFSVRAQGGVRFVTGGAGLSVDGGTVLTNGSALQASRLTGTIPSAVIGGSSITGDKLAPGSVTSGALADGAVSVQKLQTLPSTPLLATFNNPTPANADSFGYSVAAVGTDRVLIGANQDDTGANDAGAAYLFSKTGTLLTTFTNPAPANADLFGVSVAALGTDRVLIGAYAKDAGPTDSAGAAFLFSTNGTLLTTFTNPTPANSDLFGVSVAALGIDRVLIGAHRDSTGAGNTGAAYLFSTNGTLLTTFTNPTPAFEDSFGYSVAAVGTDRVLIGAFDDSTGATNTGAAYLFSTNGTLLTTFTNPTPAFGDQFGVSVAALGSDRVLIGANSDDAGATNSGAAYLFSTNGTLLTTFTNPSVANGDLFGYSVAAAGTDRVLIGAPDDDLGVAGSGTAYLFSTNGTLLATLVNPTVAPNDYFGFAVAALGSGQIVVGQLANDAGTAYLFSLDGTPYVPGLVSQGVVDQAITSAALAPGAVTADKFSAGAVLSALAASNVNFQAGNTVIGAGNVVSNGVVRSTIAGGGITGFPNSIGSDSSFIGAGNVNCIGNGFNNAFIGAGFANTILGYGGFIGAGNNNRIDFNAFQGVIAGGDVNQIAPSVSFGTIPGGQRNFVGGDFGFAAGRRAKANHAGAFVWADSTDADFGSTGTNQLLVRATGGVGINKTNPATALDVNGTVTASNFVTQDGTPLFAGLNAGALTNLNATSLTGTVPDARLSANVSKLGSSIDSAEIANGTITTNDLSAAVLNGTFWKLGGNAGTNPTNNFLGTTDDQPLEFKVNNRRGLRLEFNERIIYGATINVIGGHEGNEINSGVGGGTISGGGNAAGVNIVSHDFGTVGGGYDNRTLGLAATVGGGQGNNARGYFATVGGGAANEAYDNDATVGGGRDNRAKGVSSTVGGGEGNITDGDLATIPGGHSNFATDRAFAAGSQAKANHTGAFVWGDSQNTDFASTAANQFLIRASGGVGINTNNPNGAALAVNGTITATGFSGNGSSLTSLNATQLTGTVSDARLSANVARRNQINTFTANQNIQGTLEVAGTVTATGFSGNGSGLTGVAQLGSPNAFESSANFAGPVTAPAFFGEGAGLAGVAKLGSANTFEAGSSFNGTVTATSFSGNGSALTGVAALGAANTFNSDNFFLGLISAATVNSGTSVRVDTLGLNNGAIFGAGSPGLTFGGGNSGEGIASKRTAGGNQFGLDFYTGYTARLSIQGNGNVGVGRLPTANKLEVEGNASKTTASGWAANSDRRIKQDIQTVDSALDNLNRVRLVSFRYTDDYRATHPSIEQRRYLNVIAQEFAEVFPDHVQSSGEKLPDGSEILQVDTYPLTIYSAAAIQELSRKVEEKDAKIADLEARLEKLERMMEAQAAGR